ncbi:MAG: phosphoribosylanthranilate isomerase [Methanocellales archaeon]|nr:phosphoribosylanthranilate isomerase [Methanocellales archaeon]MDD3421367.1 phosphoribosylanthranilate isomerase [Methanocellales archaeon]
MNMVKVKVCGITSSEDAILAVESGADMIGFIIDVPVDTQRKVSLEKAIEISKDIGSVVAVLMPRSAGEVLRVVRELKPCAVQLHGYEPNSFVREVKSSISKETKIIKTVHINLDGKVKCPEDTSSYLENLEKIADFVLLDTVTSKEGGTGMTHDWMVSRRIKDKIGLPIILAGGLTPENVSQAVKVVKPYAVDVASGVEIFPGKKDSSKVKSFIKSAKEVKGCT